MAPPGTATDGFSARLIVLYGTLFTALGVQLPFFPAWLAALDLDAAAVGIILGVPMAVRVIAVFVVARVADHLAVWRGALIACLVATIAAYALLGLGRGFWPILLATALATACFAPAFPLADAYALKGLAARGRAYGPVRLWGSAAFIAGSVGTGFLLPVVGARHLVWLMTGAFAATAIAAVALLPVAARQPIPASARGGLSVLLRLPGLVPVVAAASLIQASHALYYGFSTLAWTAAGYSGGVVGGLWAIGVIAEILLFAVSPRFPPWLGPARLLGIGAVGAVVRWTVMAFDPPPVLLPLVQSLHGLSFGATFLGAVVFLSRSAPDHIGATAQGTLVTATGIMMAISMSVSGPAYAALGAGAYFAMAGLAVAGLGFVLMAHRTLGAGTVLSPEGGGRRMDA